jgi:DNA repair exonuclease SbcCD ATPase subunit
MQASKIFAVSVLVGGASAAQSNPLGEVLSLLDGLSAKVAKEGENEAKAYKDYYEWCDDVSKNTGFAIKTAASEKESLEATIAEMKANIEAADAKIGDLAASVASGSSDLKSATAVREKEVADFTANDKELVDVVDTLTRASTILQREAQKNPASFAQVASKDFAGLVQTLGTIVDAAAFSSKDKQRLLALVQSQDGDEDSEYGAPAAATYKSHSGGILDVVADLQEKAETQLSDLRHAEESAAHNYAMLKQSLEDQLSADGKAMDATKTGKAANGETLATAEGDLEVTDADLKSGNEALDTAQSNCMTVAADHEATVRARNEELKVIAQAKKILSETTSGAVGQSYSFLQIRTRADLAHSEIVMLIKKLAKQQQSTALAQLASRIAAVARAGSGDPFAKIKTLITDMIAKLESDASSEATEKQYCDEELSKTEAKKVELNEDIAKLSTKIDQASSRSAQLKAEVSTLQAELATLAKEQADNEAWRSESHAAYVQAKSDLELGLGGVRKALEVLRDYYSSAASAALVQQPAPPMPAAHGAAAGAGESIIGILEVVESDFATNLAKEETEESDAQTSFDADSQEFKITKTSKEQDVKYKTQDFTGLDKSISDLSNDRDTEQTELSAVLDYYGKLKGRCIAKPETYGERKKRRDAEISGLKDALTILENEAAFVQRRGKRHNMRGGALQL